MKRITHASSRLTSNILMLRIASYIGLLVGLLVLTWLLVWQGIDEIFELLSHSGFSLLLLPIVWFPGLIAAVISWHYLFPIKRIPAFKQLFPVALDGQSHQYLAPGRLDWW